MRTPGNSAWHRSLFTVTENESVRHCARLFDLTNATEGNPESKQWRQKRLFERRKTGHQGSQDRRAGRQGSLGTGCRCDPAELGRLARMSKCSESRRFAQRAESGQGILRHLRRPRLLIIALAILAAAISAIPGNAEKLQRQLKKESIFVRVVGRAAPLPVSTFGANEQPYIVMLQPADKQEPSLAKLVYRFLSYDRTLPAVFLDYDLVHKFRAVRQPECDEVAGALLYSLRSTGSGGAVNSELSFEYARQATGIAISPQAVLPCYVASPADHQGSTRSLAGRL